MIRFLLLAVFLPSAAFAESLVLPIGWSGPLSGNSAVLGIDSVQAVQMAVDEVNAAGGIRGRKVQLIAEDDQYDTRKAVTAYSKLVRKDSVSAILMSTYGGVFATGKRAKQDGVLVINPLDCNNDIAALPENTFCIATESESIARIIAAHILSADHLPTAIIYDEKNPFMVLVMEGMVTALEKDSKKLILRGGVSGSAFDFRPTLLRARKNKVQSIVFLGHDPMGQAMKEARQLNIDAQFYTVGTITSPGFQQLAGEAANGTLVAFWEAPKSEEYRSFISRFTKRVGRPPILELATMPSYDSAKVLLEGLSRSVAEDGTVDVEKLRSHLYSLDNYSGLSGALTMDPDGAVRTIRETLYVFGDGKLSIFKKGQ